MIRRDRPLERATAAAATTAADDRAETAGEAAGLHSAIYHGHVRHRRFEPRTHHFAQRLFLLYLDLAELDHVFDDRWFWSVERGNLASFHRQDYFGDPSVDLATAVRDRVAEHSGHRPAGPIRVLTHLRYFGYCFNPVSFYYCFDAADQHLEAVLAEITNTPWHERHTYVVPRRDGDPGGRLEARFAKDFHVSPFFGMDHDYVWRFGRPGASLGVQMENHRAGRLCFDATLSLERRRISGPALARALGTHPFMTGQVLAAIYWQALRLKLKRLPVHPHPRKRQARS